MRPAWMWGLTNGLVLLVQVARVVKSSGRLSWKLSCMLNTSTSEGCPRMVEAKVPEAG